MYYQLAISLLIVITLQHYQHICVAGEIFMKHGDNCRNICNKVIELERQVADQGRIIEQLVDMVKRSATTDGTKMESNANVVYQNITGTSLVKNKNKLKRVVNSGRGIRRAQRRTIPANNGVVTDHVAFTAFLDHPVTDLVYGMVVKFSGTLLNDGNGYDIHTGIFTVPVDGTYLFTFSIARTHANQLVAKLVVDGAGMVDAIADPDVESHEHQGTNTAIIRVRKGQSVAIKAVHLTSGTLFSLTNDRYCTFSGVLLY